MLDFEKVWEQAIWFDPKYENRVYKSASPILMIRAGWFLPLHLLYSYVVIYIGTVESLNLIFGNESIFNSWEEIRMKIDCLYLFIFSYCGFMINKDEQKY